ncbi:MAG: ArsR/SmtB family transcription factor [Saprospiraceae bacterium]
MSTTPFPIAEDKLTLASDILRAITHPLRMQILDCISKKGIATVQEIHTELDIEQSLTSQHLRILRRVDLVSAERDGKFVNYRVMDEKIALVNNAVTRFLEPSEVQAA